MSKEELKNEDTSVDTPVIPQKTRIKSSKTKHLPVKTICYCAVLMALSVVTNVFTVYFNFSGSNALSFTYTVTFLAGAFFGPFAGFIVGAGGDFLGWLIHPQGAFNPFITLTSGLLGFLPGIVFMVAKIIVKKEKTFNKLLTVFTVISFVLTWAICTNLNTVIFFYSYIYGKSTKYSALGVYYIYRIPFQTLFWAVNLALSLALVYPFKKIVKVL